MTLRGNILLLALLALLATTVGGFVFYHTLGASARQNLVAQEEDLQKDLVDHLQLELQGSQDVAAALAGVPDLARVLEEPSPHNLSAANGILDHFQATLRVEVCYLIGGDGMTIASSNRAAADSFVGKNYAFRPYFHEALAGRPATYAALGVTSLKRGLYFAQPVRGKDQRILGVLAVKGDIAGFVAGIYGLRKGPAFLVAPQGVVFASNRSDHLYRLLWEPPKGEVEKIAASLQFGKGPFEWSGFRTSGSGPVTDTAGHSYELRELPVAALQGWRVVYLLDHRMLAEDPGLKALSRVGAGVALFCLCLMAVTATIFRRAIKDVRLRQQAAEDLRIAKEQLQALVNASPLSILLIDNEGKVQLWNIAAERMFGWRAEEVLGRPLPIVPAAQDDEFQAIRKQMLDGTAFSSYETQRTHKDGTLLDVLLSTAPIYDEAGGIAGTMAVVEDITDRKRSELQRSRSQSLQSIGILAGGIAHDFNNLLASVLAVVTLIKRIDLPREKMLQRLEDAETSCKQARELTARLLTFAPGGAPQRKSVDLAGLLRSTVEDSLRGSLVQAQFDLGPLRAEVDEVQVRQVIQNLAKNALEAMPEGGTWTIEAVECELEQKNPLHLPVGRFARISLIDTGPGIPEQTLAQVFDPYFSTKKTFSDKGLGLGLTVCHSVVRRHGGAIQVESEIGKGTRFTIWLPLQEEGPQP